MQNENTFHVVAWWSSGKTGLAKCDSAPNAIHFTAPPQFGGVEGRWTPEDLLLGAVAGCYTTTFRALAEYSQFTYADLEVEVNGSVEKVESGYMFKELVVRAMLTISSAEERPRAIRLLDKAKRLCLVSRALSLAQRFDLQVQLAVPRVKLAESL